MIWVRRRKRMGIAPEYDRLAYPHVVAATEVGDEGRMFVTASTNNHDTVVEVQIYWHFPADGGEPVLMVEVDEASDGEHPMDINLRIRRNDGLIFEGTRAETTYIEEGP
jgi:hypothetical protein